MTQPLLFEPPTPTKERPWFDVVLEHLDVVEGAAWPDKFGKALRQWSAKQRPIRTLSLFSGGGGLDIAFHDLGFEIVEMVELEEKYANTLKLNARDGALLSGSRVTCLDVRQYQPDPSLGIEFIIGGPPCQTFSAAGRRAAGVSGTTDARGTLFEEYVRVLETLKPRGFLFENVYGITGAQNGEAWRDIQAAFREAGYIIHSRVLDAADYGVPQYRERLFIVGVRDDINSPFLFPFPTHGPDSSGKRPYYTASQAVLGADTTGATPGIGGRYGHLLNDIPPGLNYSFYTSEMGHPYPVFSWRSKFSDFLYKADPDTPVRTIKAQGGQYTGPFSWESRPFTVAELKRLQTFPDDYQVSGKKQTSIQQIGNSVPPQLGRILALAIRKQLVDGRIPFPVDLMPPAHELNFRQRKRSLTKHYAAKAAEALEILRIEDRLQPTVVQEYAIGNTQKKLGQDFAWTDSGHGTTVSISYGLSESEWQISGHCEPETSLTYEIVISPTDGQPWVLDVEKVRLTALDSKYETYTALWKSLEERIHDVTGNADLVQLCGYYQYTPRIKSEMQIRSPLSDEWTALARITQGTGVGVQLKVGQLAYLWGVEPESVVPTLLHLRRIGFEVRGHSTNSQIPVGEYLIPYAFPTLTPRSVQLRKELTDA